MTTSIGLPLKQQVPLKDYCTFGIGGPTRYFLEVRTVEELQQAFEFIQREKLPYFILGKGSNCLFDDKGFNGVVLLNKIDFFETRQPGVFHVGAGYSFALLGVQTARQGWTGLEFASGIPASVGGAVYMNAGANGKETASVIESVDYVTDQGEMLKFERSQLTYSYRHSPFQKMKGCITGATFALSPDLEARKQQIQIVNHRKQTQPLKDKSAGCVFLNPQGTHAGALIDQCQLKGKTIGDAKVSEIHANFLVNIGNASSSDMKTLIKSIQEEIKGATGYELKTEVRFIPYEWENK